MFAEFFWFFQELLAGKLSVQEGALLLLLLLCREQ
jgi:hypothetical protein